MKNDDQPLRADPQEIRADELSADFEAGRQVPVLEFLQFLYHGVRAHEADMAKGAHKRKPVAESASPDGGSLKSILEKIASGTLGVLVEALRAASNRAASRRIPDEQRDKDCRAALAALDRLEAAYGPQTYKLRVKQLAAGLNITAKRAREALRRVADVRPALILAESRSREGLFYCEGCAIADAGDDACLIHAPADALFEAGLPDEWLSSGMTRTPAAPSKNATKPGWPRKGGYLRRAASAGKIGFAPLKAHTFPLFRGDQHSELRESVGRTPCGPLVESWVESWKLLALPLPRLLNPTPAVPQETWRQHPDRERVSAAEGRQPVSYYTDGQAERALQYREASAATLRFFRVQAARRAGRRRLVESEYDRH